MVHMDGILNEVTNTVHKQETGGRELHTVCGVTYNIAVDQLEPGGIDQLVTSPNTSKCGRCFEDGGGY